MCGTTCPTCKEHVQTECKFYGDSGVCNYDLSTCKNCSKTLEKRKFEAEVKSSSKKAKTTIGVKITGTKLYENNLSIKERCLIECESCKESGTCKHIEFTYCNHLWVESKKQENDGELTYCCSNCNSLYLVQPFSESELLCGNISENAEDLDCDCVSCQWQGDIGDLYRMIIRNASKNDIKMLVRHLQEHVEH